MRFVTFLTQHKKLLWGVLQENNVIATIDQTEYVSLLDVIRGGDRAVHDISQNLQNESNRCHYRIDDVSILPPHILPKNMMCIGKNYIEHALEMTDQDPESVPKYPVIFTKPSSALIGHLGMIDSTAGGTEALDYEGELAVIIGKKGKNISREEAFDYVFGYSIVNDVTARDLQKQHQQFYKGKSLDTFAPFGPCIVHKSEINDPHQLSIKTTVNDELRQNGSTNDMIFKIDELIEVLSNGMTLEPGDVIATGTPSGVGKGFKPPKYLNKGDIVAITIDRIGTLINKVN